MEEVQSPFEVDIDLDEFLRQSATVGSGAGEEAEVPPEGNGQQTGDEWGDENDEKELLALKRILDEIGSGDDDVSQVWSQTQCPFTHTFWYT